MDYNNTYEQEIDLKDLMFVVLRKWRPILLIAVLLAVAAGGYKGGQVLLKQSSPEYVQDAQKKYEEELSLYERTKASIQREIDNLTVNIEKQEEYVSQSILMEISPYDVTISSADFLVKTDYEIMPNMVYQNINYADSLLKSYLVSVKKECLKDYADKKKLELKYLEELVLVEADYNNDMLHIEVRHWDGKEAETIMDTIIDNLNSMTRGLSTSITTHTLTIMNQNTSATVDLAIADKQNKTNTDIDTLRDSLVQKEKELDEMKEPVMESVSKMAAVKSGIKYAVLGGVLGAFMTVFFICVGFLMSDKVASSKELKNRFGVNILGVLGTESTKRGFDFVDRWLDQMEGVDVVTPEAVRYEVIAANIRNYAKEAESVLITGTADKAVLEEAAGKLRELLGGMEVTWGEDMRVTARTLELLSQYENVVLVEEKGLSTYTGVSQELDTIKNVGKTAVGCILVS